MVETTSSEAEIPQNENLHSLPKSMMTCFIHISMGFSKMVKDDVVNFRIDLEQGH